MATSKFTLNKGNAKAAANQDRIAAAADKRAKEAAAFQAATGGRTYDQLSGSEREQYQKTGSVTAPVKTVSPLPATAPVGKQYVRQSDGTDKLFDIPGYTGTPQSSKYSGQQMSQSISNPNWENPSTNQNNVGSMSTGIFTNASTGQLTNAQGQPVDASGKLISTPETKAPEQYPGSTRYDQYGNQLPAEVLTGREQLSALGEQLFPGQKTVYNSVEEELKAMVDAQKKEKEALRRDIDVANKGDELAVSDAKRAGERAIEGTTATFAQSREAPTSATNPQIATDFANITNQRIGFAIEQKENARIRRESLMGQMEEAQREGRAARVIELQNEISAAQAAEDEAQAKIMAEEDKATQTSLDLMKFDQDVKDAATTAVTNQFEKMGLGIVDMSIENLMAMVQGTNISLPAALAWQAGAKLEAEALKTTNEAEAAYKMAQADKLKAEIKNVGKPAQVLEYEYYQTLPPGEQAKFRELKNAGYGFMKMQNADGTETLIATNQNDGTAIPLYSSSTGGGGGQIPKEPPVTEKIGNKSVSAQPVFMTALQQADADMFAATGQHININQSFRTAAQQQAIRDGFGYTSNDQKSGAGGLAMAAPVGTSFHEMGLAVDVTNWKEAQPYLEKYGVVNGIKNDMGHFSMGELNPDVFAGPSEAASIAENIMNGTSKLTLKDIPQKQRAAVDAELSKLKDEALSNGDFEGVMKASAGGVNPGDAFKTAMKKGSTVLGQLSSLSNLMLNDETKDKDTGEELDLSPLSGWLSKKNPWDTDAQTIQGIIQATIPNLARGVYGEVGVLTDEDVALYSKTIPNLTSTEEVKKALLAATLSVIRDAMKSQIEIEARSGADMSNFTDYYQNIQDKIDLLEEGVGIVREGAEVDTNPFGQMFEDERISSLFEEPSVPKSSSSSGKSIINSL